MDYYRPGEGIQMMVSCAQQDIKTIKRENESLRLKVEELEEKNRRLEEARENANAVCAKWEGLYRAELEKKAGKPAWIRVEDRMPEDGLPSGRVQVTVLACTKAKRTIIASRVYEPERTFEYGEIKKTYPARWIWSKNMNKQVTHWMPLPEPPGESG